MAVSNRIVVVLVFLVIVNICFSWFGLMGFIHPETMPSSGDIKDPLSGKEYSISFYNTVDIILYVVIGGILSVMAYFASNYLKINAFSMILFTDVIWIPFLSTLQIFNSIFISAGVPIVFYGTLLSIFGFVMIILYLYTLAEWSRIPGGI
jgi:hypothetical protein